MQPELVEGRALHTTGAVLGGSSPEADLVVVVGSVLLGPGLREGKLVAVHHRHPGMGQRLQYRQSTDFVLNVHVYTISLVVSSLPDIPLYNIIYPDYNNQN